MISKSAPGGGCGNGEPDRTQSANVAALEIHQAPRRSVTAAQHREDDDRPRPRGDTAS